MRAQDDLLGERMPVDTATLVKMAFGIQPPNGSANPPCGCYDPVQAAAYHSQSQAVRRAIRSLERKELITAFHMEGDDKRAWNYELK